jgi:hypothetical protein
VAARLVFAELPELVVLSSDHFLDFSPLGLFCEDGVVEKEFLEFVFH